MCEFKDILKQRILVLDGAMGTMIQRLDLNEAAFRGTRFVDHEVTLQGNNDILSLTCPDAVCNIHKQYIAAGADIISTNTFNANSISQSEYSTECHVREINLSAAKLARKAVDETMLAQPGRKIWVAGSIGPTNRMASMSPKMDDPAFRNITYDQLFEAYVEQVCALIDGGCDLLLFETVFDTLNLKAGLEVARVAFERCDRSLPVMVSATIAGKSGRILSGQSIEALWVSIAGFDSIVSFGLNCSWGADSMKPFIEEAARTANVFISCHPNAGLPDECGQYKETPEIFAEHVEALLRGGSVNIIGGCCGTTPEHIASLRKIVDYYKPHIPANKKPELYVSGLDALEISRDKNFINIGERCNVAGSRKFLRLIKEKNYDEAMAIARKQVADGAQILDVNMDDAMIDAEEEMVHFLNLIASDPDIAKVPVMVDSSRWNVLSAALKCLQGKSIVNSISLKEGEKVFIDKARYIHNHCAAVVVMAFDEKGQADTFNRKIEICSRAYKILVNEVGFDPQDIIFDPNIMAVATGIEQHDMYACDFIKATEWIKANLPGAKVSGGVSNLSFSFRGHNMLREAMHAVFLYQAIAAGLDMAIVNPATRLTYNDIEPRLKDILSFLITNGDHAAAKALYEYAESVHDNATEKVEENAADRNDRPVSERLKDAIIKGDNEFLDYDLDCAASEFKRAIDIIEGPLMEGVDTVGRLFGEGKMFLPQVVKAARVMKQAVDILKPRINSENADMSSQSSAGKILFATVKGDVHDIGKNIVSIVLECNNYEVIDLGVMVAAETIVEEAIRNKPDLICLSGLITPSLGEMINVADKLEAAGLKTPLIVGGATTSKLHTALNIAPHLSAPVVHATDASQNPIIASKLLNPALRQAFIDELNAEYECLRNQNRSVKLLSIDEARHRKPAIDWSKYNPPRPNNLGVRVIDNIKISDVRPYINWRLFFHAWQLTGDFINDFPYAGCAGCRASWLLAHKSSPKVSEALKLYDDALRLLSKLDYSGLKLIRAAIGVFNAYSEGDNIVIGGVELPMLRRQIANDAGECKSLADYIMPKSSVAAGSCDYAGAFAVSVGLPDDDEYRKIGVTTDKYPSILLRTLLDRLAEAASEYLHRYIRTDYWGYAADESLDISDILAAKYRGIRPAVGYPMIPDQLLNLKFMKLLPFEEIGVTMTENGAMNPPASVSGLYISHPDARYFLIEQIDDCQLTDYASRRNIPLEKMRKNLIKYLQ